MNDDQDLITDYILFFVSIVLSIITIIAIGKTFGIDLILLKLWQLLKLS